jgi:hypothetical protein
MCRLPEGINAAAAGSLTITLIVPEQSKRIEPVHQSSFVEFV